MRVPKTRAAARGTAAWTDGESSSEKSYSRVVSTATMITCAGSRAPRVRPTLRAVRNDVSWLELALMVVRFPAARPAPLPAVTFAAALVLAFASSLIEVAETIASLPIAARVDEGAQGHIAADTASTVKVSNLHGAQFYAGSYVSQGQSGLSVN